MNKTKILIVEDETVIALDIRQELLDLGYEPVACAAQGEEAILLTEQLRPDLVLMDIRLAGETDGVAAAQAIRERFALPVVFLTAFADEEILQRAKLVEPFGYLVKPFRERELRAVIEMALYKHQAEARLLQSAEEHAAIVRTAWDGFWKMDLQGQLLDVNVAACRMTGYTREELLQMKIADLAVEDSPDQIAARIDRIQRNCSAQFEHRLRHRDGRLLDVEVSVNFLPLPDGQIFSFARDITERKRAEEALHEAHDRLQHLSRKLIETRETERRSLARDLHDSLGQTLTAAKIRLQSLVCFPDAKSQVKGIEEGVDALDQVIGQVRQIALALRPPLLDDLGLSAALRWLANQQTAGGLPLELAVPGNLPRFNSETEITTFRIAQEALTNATRHAQASHARLTVCLHQDTLELTVWDDGIGFDVAAARQRAAQGGSLGVLGMEERAQLVQGRLEIKSQPGHGTELRAWLPLTPPTRI